MPCHGLQERGEALPALRMALVEAERALEHWATDEDSLEGQGAVIWRTAQVQICATRPESMSRVK